MKKTFTAATSVIGLSVTAASARMSSGQGGHAMGGGSVWGMNSGWLFGVVIVVLVVLAMAVMMNRK